MKLGMSEEAAKILLMRFYVKSQRKGILVARNSAYVIADTAGVIWSPYSKRLIQIDPSCDRILDLDRDKVEVLEHFRHQVNACILLIDPFVDPSLSLDEYRLLSRSGINPRKLN